VRIEPGSAPVELRDTADAFNSMAGRLENLVGRQRAFVADASHELRTPLTALRLRLENVESVVGEEARSDVEAALAESQRLAQLVEQLLTIARSEGAARTTSTVDLASTAAERVNLWQAVAEESDVILEFRVTARPSVRGVEGVVDQVVDNLVSNAISATPEGRRVAVVVDSSSGFGRLRIIDEGPGMSPDDRERAFDRFWRSDHERPGTGLGLAIVREMVIASGGRVELNAASGGGVDAVVMLPEVPAGDATASLNR
jgi:signal transduction histidine kinase